jgi:hypothetical protein
LYVSEVIKVVQDGDVIKMEKYKRKHSPKGAKIAGAKSTSKVVKQS